MKQAVFVSRLSSVFVAVFLYARPLLAAGLPGAEARCDLNDDGFITGGEITALANLKVSPELQAYDANCDGRISAGELDYINQLVRATVEKDRGVQRAALIVKSETAPIEVPQTQQKPKRPTKRFFISKNKVTPNIDLASKSSAVLSFTDEAESGRRTLNVDGVLTYLLLDPNRETPQSGPFGEFALTAYLDANGTVRSGSDDVTSAIIGVDTIFDLEWTGLFDLQTVRVGPYYQTDFEGGAEVYGLNASWIPIRNDWLLGSARLQTGDWREHFFWQASADVDYQSVRETGETKLSVGDQFWSGVSLGAKVYPFGEIGSATPHVGLDLETRRDLRSGNDATLTSLSLNFPLTDDGKSAAVVTHENGENYQTGEQLDKTTIGFSFKF